MVVRLEDKRERLAGNGTCRMRGSCTYVQVSLRVKVKNMIMMAKHSVLGIRAVIRRNLANSLDDHALSRYLPP